MTALAIALAVALPIALAIALLNELPIAFLMDLLSAFGNSIRNAMANAIANATANAMANAVTDHGTVAGRHWGYPRQRGGSQISAKRSLPPTQPDAVQQNVGPRIGFAFLSNLSGDPVHLHPSCKWKVSTCMTDAGVQGHH